MPVRKKIYKVIKTPNLQKNIDYQASFPKMPILYLELLENKSKIKPDLVNKPYISEPSKKNTNSNEDFKHLYDIKQDIPINSSNKEIPKNEIIENKQDNNNIQEQTNFNQDIKINSEQDIKNSDQKINSDIELNFVDKEEIKENNEELKEIDSNDSDIVHKRLLELLKDDRGNKKLKNIPVPEQKNQPPVQIYTSTQHINSKQNINSKPPNMEEVLKKGIISPQQTSMPNMKFMSNDIEEDDKKREILFKFDLLRKSYPQANGTIPEFTVHSDYNTMLKEYNRNVKKLAVDSNIDKYKQYLTFGFMGIEYILSTFLKFDMQGFTQHQVTAMNSYEKLLIELGEKTYIPDTKWPVEIRLIFLIFINTAIFIVTKIITNKLGSNMFGLLNSNLSTEPKTKTKMKKPNINLDELADV